MQRTEIEDFFEHEPVNLIEVTTLLAAQFETIVNMLAKLDEIDSEKAVFLKASLIAADTFWDTLNDEMRKDLLLHEFGESEEDRSDTVSLVSDRLYGMLGEVWYMVFLKEKQRTFRF
jgi:hypothetical protein